MLNVRAVFAALLLTLISTQAMADAASHAAAAKQLLKLVNADQIASPWYGQVNQMFAQRFAEAQAPESKKAVLESYQAKADATLDKAVGWDKLEPEMVKLYTGGFSEAELKELIAFYQSPLGQKVLKQMPALFSESMKMTQTRLEPVVPQVNQLLEQMSKELAAKKP
ncbi:DUF2059 domain-containing protein [Pseudomonas sp. N040]|uniref:DUF2059 domain-containing protein n=1 Tax=Pseudomonas sp. N040 TaxID=2785325 RepID=UPI0018A2AF55|nr:DUF2059 domain-containing protein [Pseudomonas sp. N040]MBF7729455.1 DUF2059 domain-containing protein [Pseudomonas sp. N040]MBW7013095.1 DUF2059 domain-containing protein [Pseudomonas sp. N040]